MLVKLGPILGFRPSVLPSSSIVRFLSISRVNHTDAKDPELVEKPWSKYMLRYHSDAAFRQRRLAYRRAWHLQNRDKAVRTIRETYEAKHKQDIAYRQRDKARARKSYHEKYINDPISILHRRLYRWFRHQPELLATLPWKTHRPLVHDTGVEHFCQSCRVTRHNGSKLWWLRLGSHDQYQCHTCYVQDIDAAMPAGYEGITKLKGIIARNKELDALDQSNKSRP